MYIWGGVITLYNVTVALNSSGVAVGDGVFQVGGSLTSYNSLFANNGYAGSDAGPTGADYDNAASGTDSAIAFDSLFQSSPVGVSDGGGLFVADAGLDLNGLQPNGGPTIGTPATSAPTDTIGLLAGSNAIGAGLNPINSITLFTDERGFIPAGSWSIGAFQPGNAAAAPTATLSAANVAVAGYGGTSYTFTVTYSGDSGITPASLAGAVVEVVPPSGLGGPIIATVDSTVANGPTDPWGDAQSFTVTYTITPPGGKWTSADNGTYTVNLGGSPVSDTDGNTIPIGTVGSFAVETGLINYTRSGVVYKRTGPTTYLARPRSL